MAWLTLGACAPEVGPCEPDVARVVVYDEFGAPAFEGQALMISSCGGGGFCHSPEATGADRRGAPTGLDYDLLPASTTDDVEVEETERLRDNQALAFAHRREIWDQVARLRMPIRGEASDGVFTAAPSYAHLDLRTGTRRPIAPLLADDGARERLRNWLACGLPVVERTEHPAEGQPSVEPVGYVVSSQERPLEPRWDDIYDRYIGPRCATAPCHDADDPEAALDLSERAVALTSLLEGVAVPTEPCGAPDEAGVTPDRPLLVPMDADASLLVWKLRGSSPDGERVCGERMPQTGSPLSRPSLDAIRRWIDCGAMPEGADCPDG